MALLWVFSFLVACSTDQCSCTGFEQRGFPTRAIPDTVASAGQARVTASGLDFVEKQVPYLVDQFVPGGLNFCIPQDTSGNPDLCVASTCPGGAAGCGIDLTLEDQSITPLPPNTVEVSVTIGDIDERLNFDYNITIGTVNCYVQLFKKGASETTPAQVVGTIPIRLNVDGASPTKELRVEIGDPGLNLDGLDFKIHGRGNVGDTIACEGASLVRGLFRGMIESEIRKVLNDTVASIADEQLCRRCGAGFDACSAGTCDAGICRYPSDVCVPRPLGVEGRLNLGSLLTGYVKEPDAAVDVLAKAADLARVDTGVSVGLRAGFEPNALAPCVPVDPTRRPSSAAVAPSDVILADRDPQGAAFHLGVGIHKRAIEHLLWSAWASGAPCLEVGSETVSLLSTGTFQLVTPSLKDIGPTGKTAVLVVVPQKPPTVAFGANTVTQVNGTSTISAPLLTLNWPDVDFHVFGFAQDRMLRLFSLRLDLELPVALSPDGQGNVVPVVGSIEEAIRNIRPRRTELVAEGPQRILDLVPTLVGFAAPQLAGAIPESVALPEFLGFRLALDQGDLRGADNDEFLALFATLQRTTQASVLTAETVARLVEVDYSHRLPSGLVRPRVVVEAAAVDLVGAGLPAEYAWRVDGGFWGPWTSSSRPHIDDPVLALPGTHRVEVRARWKGEPATSDPVPAAFDVEIVNVAATIASTTAPPPDALDTALTPLVAKAAGEPAVGRMPAPPTGCATGAGDASWLLLFAGMGFVRRRRRWAATVATLCVLAIGCKGEMATNATTRCFGPACAPDQACMVDADCGGLCPQGTSGICEADRCQCVRACEPGCKAGEFCCLGSGQCVPDSPSCDGQMCSEGFEARVVGTPNRDTCEIDGGGCQCVALPPIPIGVHGQQLAVDAANGVTWVAAYNKTYGDLMLGQAAADGTLTWQFVDGVPTTGAITGDPNGWRGGREERGAHVGTFPGVSVDAAGRVHLVYRDEDAKALKYARGTFGQPFEFATLDATGDGMWTAITVVGDRVHVVYGSDDGSNSSLQHASFPVDVPIANFSPEMNVVVEVASDATPTKDFARRMGMFNDLSATPQGGLLVVFYDGVGERVGRSVWANGAWEAPVYLARGTGPYAAGAVDAAGLVHVAFMVGSALRYSRFGGELRTALVHDGRRDGGEYYVGPIGEDVDLWVSGDDVRIVFQDAFDRALYEARWNTEAFDLAKVPLPATEAAGFSSTFSPAGDVYVDWVVDRGVEPWGRVRVVPRTL